MSIMLGKISVKDLHGPWSDFMDKLQGEESESWFTAFKKFLRKENPWNSATKKDRITFSVIGLGLTGAQWITRLEAGGYKVYDYGCDILKKRDYDQNHRLEAGKEYKVTLVSGKDIPCSSMKISRMKEFACCEIGEQSVEGLKGELALLIREKFTNSELEAMDIDYLAVLHKPIIDSGGYARVFRLSSTGGSGHQSAVNADCDDLVEPWSSRGMFAFLIST